MNETLSPLDATFLELEQGDDSAHMHIGAVMVFDPLPEGGVPSVKQVCDQLDERLASDSLPRYRQRLSQLTTGGMTWPEWQVDTAFDIGAHVRRASLPAPGGPRELGEWAGDYWSGRLDRRRPLWNVVLLEGLADGRWALATKTHHCLVDGVGSVEASHLMLDAEPHPPSAPPHPRPPHDSQEEHRGALDLLPWPLAAGARAGVHGAQAAVGAALHPGRVVDMLERSRAVAELIVKDEVTAAPASSITAPIGTRRRYDVLRVGLGEVKAIKNALGGTVNDVVLAATTAGLRRLLESRGEDLPAQGLRAMVPVNVREAGEQLGNHISSLFVHLPVAAETTAERYRLTCEEAEALKSGRQGTGSRVLIELAGMAPPFLHATLARSLFASRLFNVTVTNVPGPQQPLYAFGARMRDVMPFVPLAAEHALGIAIVSYDGGLTFGLCADYDSVPDLDLVRDGIAAELVALAELAEETAAGPAGTAP